jgi:hypothetical protein
MLNPSRRLNEEPAVQSVIIISLYKFCTMKKIFALVLVLATIAVASAQNGHNRREARDVVLGQQDRSIYNNRRNDGYMSSRERDLLIAQIKRDYLWKMEAVKRDRYLRRGEERRQIRFLENERDEKIRAVWYRYNHQIDHRYGRRY